MTFAKAHESTREDRLWIFGWRWEVEQEGAGLRVRRLQERHRSAAVGHLGEFRISAQTGRFVYVIQPSGGTAAQRARNVLMTFEQPLSLHVQFYIGAGTITQNL